MTDGERLFRNGAHTTIIGRFFARMQVSGRELNIWQ
jgi:hypothetical protein